MKRNLEQLSDYGLLEVILKNKLEDKIKSEAKFYEKELNEDEINKLVEEYLPDISSLMEIVDMKVFENFEILRDIWERDIQ